MHRVEPADPHGLLSPDVAAREDHLERAPAAEEMRESSRPSGPREDPHCHLGLTEDRTFAPVAQIERGEELRTTTSRGAVDDADRDQAAAMQTLEQRGGDVRLVAGTCSPGGMARMPCTSPCIRKKSGSALENMTTCDAVVRLQLIEQPHRARR